MISYLIYLSPIATTHIYEISSNKGKDKPGVK